MDLTDFSFGEFASIAAALSWSVSILIFRKYGHLSAPWLNLFKGTVALVCLAATIAITADYAPLSASTTATLTLSGLIGILIGDTAFFLALPRIGGSLAASIQCLSPPVTAFLAYAWLGEHLTAQKLLGLLVTSCAVAALIWLERPAQYEMHQRSRNFSLGAGYALLAAICQAIGAVISKEPLLKTGAVRGTALRLWMPVLLLGLWEWRKRRQEGSTFVAHIQTIPKVEQLVFASFLGTYIGLILMLYGMAHAPIGVALALNTTYPLWITGYEGLILKKKISVPCILSVIAAIAGVIAMSI